MAVDFSILSKLATPKQGVVAQIAPSGGSSDGGLGELLGGLQSLFKGVSGASTGTTAQDPGSSGDIVNGINTATNAPQTNAVTNAVVNGQGSLDSRPRMNQLVEGYVSNNITKGLNPELVDKTNAVMQDLRAQGFQPKIAEGLRTPAQQAEKVRLGYSKTMNSNHLHGGAVDIIDARYGWDTKKYNNEIKSYSEALAASAQKHGLMSGTAWKSYGPYGDFAHLQLQGPTASTPPKIQLALGPSSQVQNGQPISSTQQFHPKNSSPDLSRTMAGIAYVESGGAKNPYLLMSKPSGNDRAYGKYQIMGNNIPSWTQEAIGIKMSPQQFLADPAAQERTAAFHLNKSLQKYGMDDAASIWFSGRPMNKAGNARDVYGTTVPAYVDKFRRGAGQAGQSGPDVAAASNPSMNAFADTRTPAARQLFAPIEPIGPGLAKGTSLPLTPMSLVQPPQSQQIQAPQIGQPGKVDWLQLLRGTTGLLPNQNGQPDSSSYGVTGIRGQYAITRYMEGCSSSI